MNFYYLIMIIRYTFIEKYVENTYHRYIREDVEEKDLPGLTDRQLTKIKSKMKSSWFKSLMLKKKVLATLDFEECAEKQIIFVYHIMEN